MKRQNGLVHLAFLVAASVVSAAQSIAGSCDCHPEISNAGAITVSHCAKQWTNNECTLKEDGTSNITEKLTHALQSKLRFNFNFTSTPRYNLAKGRLDANELDSAIADMTTDQNVDFIASVLDLYHDNLEAVSKYWGGGSPLILKSSQSMVVLKRKCFYAQSTADKSNNFYVNFNDGNDACDAWESLR